MFEFAPKGELFELLTKAVSFSEKKTRSIMCQLFEGVDYMHSKNIVHRDLKVNFLIFFFYFKSNFFIVRKYIVY